MSNTHYCSKQTICICLNTFLEGIFKISDPQPFHFKNLTALFDELSNLQASYCLLPINK